LITTENAQIDSRQQIEALFYDNRFQKLEEKLTTSSFPVESTSFMPNKSSQITETMTTCVIDEYRDRETHKPNVITHNAP